MTETPDDWFDEAEAGGQAAVERQLRFSGFPSAAASLAGDPLTRLWQDATPIRETGADAVATLRDRKRQEGAAAPKRHRGWWRG